MGQYRNEQSEEAGPITNSDLPGAGAARDRFKNALICNHCGQIGEIIWEENAAGYREAGVQRRLIGITPGFHTEDKRTKSGDPVIVCTRCDTILPD